MENLVAEKNDLSLSFLHHSLPRDQDDEVSNSSNQVFHRDGKSSQTFTFVPTERQFSLSLLIHYSII